MLIDEIKRIVQEESGGIKMTKLVVKLMPHLDEYIDQMTVIELLDFLEQIIEEDEELDILTYHFKFGEVERMKQFIYRR